MHGTISNIRNRANSLSPRSGMLPRASVQYDPLESCCQVSLCRVLSPGVGSRELGVQPEEASISLQLRRKVDVRQNDVGLVHAVVSWICLLENDFLAVPMRADNASLASTRP